MDDPEESPRGYAIIRYAGRYYVTYDDGPSTFTLDEFGYFANVAKPGGDPPWPPAPREPKPLATRARAARFARDVEAYRRAGMRMH